MSNKYTFAILGGDMRQMTVAELLLEHGHRVRVFGADGFVSGTLKREYSLTVKKAVEGCDAVILPLPVSRDGIALNQPCIESSEPVTLKEILTDVAKNENKLILGGIIPDTVKELSEKLGITVADYYECGDLQNKNALPSAEGALMLVMENSDTVIEGMNVLVTGFGKTGRLTAEKLRALGANVYVAARRDEVLCDIAMSGFLPIHITDELQMKEALDTCSTIINTVPHIIFTQSLLHDCKTRPLYIEIASLPGGIDIPAARGMGIRSIFAPSLSGKYAPVSAGRYIFEAISDIMRKGGMEI